MRQQPADGDVTSQLDSDDEDDVAFDQRERQEWLRQLVELRERARAELAARGVRYTDEDVFRMIS